MLGERGLPALPQDTGKHLKLQGLWARWLTRAHTCGSLPSTDSTPMTAFSRPASFSNVSVFNASYWWRYRTVEGAATGI
jgi:hypothetical protein